MVCGVCFFSGGGDVRIGSVSGILSCGCDLDQLERDSREHPPSRLVPRDIARNTGQLMARPK